MRGKLLAGALMALAFVIPAAPAAAAAEPGLDQNCQTVERKVYKDMRTLLTIDLDTATNIEVRVLTTQIMSAATRDGLAKLPDIMQERLDGTDDDRRAFLKSGLQDAWLADLRLEAYRTLDGKVGDNVRAAAKEALDAGTIDALLAYLNDGLYAARELDCDDAPPPPTPTATPTATSGPTPTASADTPGAPAPDAPDGSGGGLAVTGADAATVAVIGGVLLLLGGAGYLIGRRRRSRFVA